MMKIYFDMDGTVYDLYGITNWLELLTDEKTEAFTIGKPLVNIKKLNQIASLLVDNGVEFGIITWLPKNATNEYEAKCAEVKREWKNQYMPFVNEFYAVPYGTPKHKVPAHKAKTMVIFDDNAEIRKEWQTKTQRVAFNVGNIVEELEKIYCQINNA